MRPPSYRQRLFVEHDFGESSGSTVDVGAGLGIQGLKSWGREKSRKVRETRSSSSQKL